MQSKQHFRRVFFLPLALLFLGAPAGTVVAQSGLFTVQIGSPPPAPITLVSAASLWQYRPGTSEPQADWMTAPDASLDATWLTGQGGFGYGDAGIVGENTTISGMENVHSTLCIRQTFTVTTPPASNAPLSLVVDYDDGFVAYLDGQEIARANLTTAPGTFVSHTATTGGNSHEASCCNAPTHPPEAFSLGTVSNRLAAGTHVLALMGVNQALNSSDFHLIPSLEVGGAPSGVVNGPLLSVVQTNSTELSGTNTVAGSTRVVVNGDEADFNLAQGTWTKTQMLAPGVNHLTIQALDAVGHILASTNRLVVADLGSVTVGGTLAPSEVWRASDGIVRLTRNAIVPPGGSLTIEDGVVVLCNEGCSIRATNASITATGTPDGVTYFLPADGTTGNWGELVAVGTSGNMLLQHVETLAGHVELINGATGTLEDSYFHDYTVSDPAIIHTLGTPNHVTLNLRRCYISHYHEVLSQLGTNHIEGCLLEYQDYSGDGIDFDAGQPGSYIRRCTLRRGEIYNTDALDMGEYGPTGESCRGVLIDSCLLHNFIDKGVSMGVRVDVSVTNCVIYNVDAGIAVKDNSIAGIFNTTIADSDYGFHCYNKANPSSPSGGGYITNSFNNILGNDTTPVSLLNGSTLAADYSDFQNGSQPGVGNISSDPLFVDAAQNDYRLSASSPCLGTGSNHVNMGATYPVGGIPGGPFDLAALTLTPNQIDLAWGDDADNEAGFEVQRSTDAATWQTIGATGPNETNFTDAAMAFDQHYYYRVQATNDVGVSLWSGIAGATLEAPVTVAGGTLTSNTVWSGTVLVFSTVTVPSGLSLTVQPGTTVKLTNGVSISAQANGVIDVEGEFTNRVVFQPMVSGASWGPLDASGSGSSVTIRHAELDHGGVNLGSQATGWIEGVFVHDVYSAIVGSSAHRVTVRRTHVKNYSETIYNSTPVLVEDCLLEDMTDPNSDALEIQGAQAAWNCTVRRCTARNSTGNNSDSYDFNGSSGVLLEDCIAHDFSDKGISLGASGQGGVADFGITVRNCLIYHVDTGIAVKDGSTVTFYQNTIADSAYGMRLYQKYTTPADGGHVTNGYNNIIWGNTTGISLEDSSSVVLDHSDVQGAGWPGDGNLSANPLFTDDAQQDYHLAPGSPCLGTGRDGLDMGVIFPTGVFINTPGDLAAVGGADSVSLTWQDKSVSESVYEVERSVDGGSFALLATLPEDTTGFVDTDVAPGHEYRYRVRGRNLVADSDYSNEAVGSLCQPPVITMQPQSQVVVPGSSVTLSVTVTGCGPFAYQWYEGTTAFADQTNEILTLTNVVEANSGDYTLVITDSAQHSTTSSVARITVTAGPEIQLASGGTGINSNGLFSLQFNAPTNTTLVIQASTNFVDWLPVETNSVGNGRVDFVDPDSTHFGWRFYRALLKP